MRLIPLTEGSCVDLDDSALDKGVCPDELVVRGIVNNTDNPRLFGDMLRSPCKVARIEAESSVFEVSTTNTDSMDALGAKLGVGGLTAKLKLSLLAIMSTLCASR